MLDEIDPINAICFTGHRPDRLPGRGDPDDPEAQKLAASLQTQIEDSVLRGKHNILHGAMAGFDLFAIEQAILLKKQYPQIKIITVAPYKEAFFSREKCWTPEWINRARAVFDQHDIGIRIAERYRTGIYFERNRALVEHSSEIITYWDGGSGGTAYTVECGKRKGLAIYNLYQKR